MKMALAIYVMFDTPTPRRRSPCLSVELRLSGPKPRNSALSGLPRSSMLRLGEPLCLGIALLHLGVPISSVLGTSLPLILTIIHWINENPNK